MAANKLAADYFERYPKDRYQTEIESWRHLQSDNIEVTMKRLREPIDADDHRGLGRRTLGRFVDGRAILVFRCKVVYACFSGLVDERVTDAQFRRGIPGRYRGQLGSVAPSSARCHAGTTGAPQLQPASALLH
jgi:hypothetical protein